MTHKLSVIPPMPEWAVGNPLWEKAVAFAAHAHRDQVRKYTGEPYIYHPLEVAQTVWDACRRYNMWDNQELVLYPEMMVAAVCHDVVEDCSVTFTELEREFGKPSRDLVFWLTDGCPHSFGNRSTRKELEAVRLGAAPLRAKIIKLADLKSNTKSIAEHDPNFARVYFKEKEFILSQMHWSGSGDLDALLMCFPEIFKYLYKQVKEQVLSQQMS